MSSNENRQQQYQPRENKTGVVHKKTTRADAKKKLSELIEGLKQ